MKAGKENLIRLVKKAMDEGLTKEQVLSCIHRTMDARKEQTVTLPYNMDSRILDRELELQKERSKHAE